MRTKGLLCVLLAATLFAAGCSKFLARGKSDAETAQAVMTKIFSDPNVPTKQISVQSNNGVVTLSGNVASDNERQAAAGDAAQVEGVRTVVNNLQVAPTSAQAAPSDQAMNAPLPEPLRKPSPRMSQRQYSARNSRPALAPSYNEPAPSETPVREAASTPPPAPAQPPAPQPITIESGTPLSIRMVDAIDTATNQEGDTFRATLDAPVMVGDKVVIPTNADVIGRVAALRTAGHFTGQSQLALELTKVSFGGRTYSIMTDQYTKQGTSRGKNTAEKVGGGAAVGAILGGILGGGKGAAIGATVGAGAGGGVQAATKGQQIKVPSEAVLRFRLDNPVTVTPSANAGRSRTPLRTDNSGDYSDDNPQQ